MAETGRKKRLPELGRRGFLAKSRDVREGSPLKQGPGGSPKRPNSPEPNCSICLGGIEDQSFANKCFHSFCRTCLFEWSKVKPECPVCRQGFDSIIFNVKAMDDYEEYNIPRPLSPRSLWSVGAFITESNQSSWQSNNFNILRHRVIHLQDMFSRNARTGERETPGRPPRRLSFFYAIDQQSRDNSTNTGPTNSSSSISSTNTERTPPRAHESSRNSVFPFEIAAYFRNLDHGHQRTPTAGTFDHRRYIYEHDLWVQPIVGRLARECSASFYRNNPAVTHRLLPFLNRELVAILRTDTEPNHSAEALLSRIKAAIFEYDIPSIRFRQVIEPYTRDKTHHFLHELYYFAKSPYTIEDYNVHAIYVPKAHVKQLKLEQPISRSFAVFTHEHPEPETDSSTDDSVIEVVDSEQEEQSSRRSENRMQCPSASTSTSTKRTTTVTPAIPAPTIETSRSTIEETRKAVIRKVFTERTFLMELKNRLTSQANQEPRLISTLPQNINVIEDFDNPRPGPSGLCRKNDFRSSSTKTKVDDDGSETEIDVGTNEKPMIKQNYDSDSDDSDDSIKVVGYKKPIRERTPEIINISSCGESDNNRSDYDSADDNDEEPQKKRIKKNGDSVSKFLAKSSGHRFKSEIGKGPLVNEDDKITDSEGSENEKERSSKKKQKKRRKTKSSHSKRRKESSSSRHVDFDGTTPTDTTSSEDESPVKRGEIEPFKFLRRIPSVIVRPPTLRTNNVSLNMCPFRPTHSSTNGIHSSGNGGSSSNTLNASNNSSGGIGMASTSSPGTSSNVIATLCSSLKRKFDESTDSESTDNNTTERFNDIIKSYV